MGVPDYTREEWEMMRSKKPAKPDSEIGGQIIKKVHACFYALPDPRGYPVGTQWRCDCGNIFERVTTDSRVPEPWWDWINRPARPKEQTFWQKLTKRYPE